MAHQETLKLIPTLIYFSPDSALALRPALVPLATLLLEAPLASPPLQPPTTHYINALLNLNPSSSKIEDATLRDPLFPPSSPTSLTDHLIEILTLSLPSETTPSSDPILSPLVSLLRTLHSTAPPEVQTSMRSQLLPQPSDRDSVLGKSATLPSRLLRAATAPATTTLRDVVSALLYELCGSDATVLVQNIGYGYAVGILARLGVEMDGAALGAGGWTETDGEEAREINPVTGQRRDKEVDGGDPFEGMTEEEKEREAEKLFVLFERLKATGVVDVKNPVELAREQGKFD